MAGLTEGRTSDTGVAFCARADFEAIGGYREDAARRYWYGEL